MEPKFQNMKWKRWLVFYSLKYKSFLKVKKDSKNLKSGWQRKNKITLIFIIT